MNDDVYVIYTHIFYAHLVCTTCVHLETLYMYTHPHLFLFGLYIHHYLLLQTTRLSASFIGRNSKKQAIVGSSKSKKKKKNEKLSSITKPPRVHSQTNTKAPPSSDDTKESIRAMMPFVRLQESPLGFESIGGESHNTMAMSTASTHVISNVVISIQQQIDASAHEELKRKKKMEALAREKKEREEQRRIKEKQALEAERIKLEEELKRKKKKMEALAREKKEREQRRIKKKQALEAERIKLETQLKNEQAKQKLIDEIAVREKRLTAIRERKNQVIKEKDAAMEEARRISSHSTNKSSKEKCASQRRSRSKSRQTRRKPIKKANNEDDSTTFGGGDLWDNDTNRKSKVKTKKKLLLKDGMIVPMDEVKMAELKSKKKKNLFVERSSGTIGVDADDQQREENETKRKKKKQAAVAGQSTKNIEHNTMQLNVPKEIEKKGRAFNLVPSLPRSKVSRGRTSSLGRKSNNKESKVVPKKKKFLRGTTRPKTLDKFEIESRVSTLAIESVLAAEEHVKKERQGQGSMIQLNMPEKKMEKKTNSTKLDELEEDVESKDVSTLLGFRDWQAKMAKKDNAKSKRSLSLSWRRNKDKFDTTDDSTTDVPNSVAYVVKKESCDVMSSSKDDNIAEKGGTNWFASWFTGWANAPASEESKEAINDKVANMGSGWANDGPSNDGVVSDGEEEDDETADEESKDDVGWFTYDTGTVDDVTSHKDDKRKYTDDRDDNYADGETTVGSYTDDGTNLTADSSIREGWFSKWANDGGGEEDVTIDEYQGSLYCEVEETIDERYYSSLEDSSDDEYEESSDDESDESSDDESSDDDESTFVQPPFVVIM